MGIRMWFTLLLLLGIMSPGVSARAADAGRGRQLYEQRCTACHSMEQNRVGPMHRGVFGRKVGSAVGYDYSAALAHGKIVWDERTLDAWLSDPEKLIPGQRMGYSVPNATDRADLIAYLRTESGK